MSADDNSCRLCHTRFGDYLGEATGRTTIGKASGITINECTTFLLYDRAGRSREQALDVKFVGVLDAGKDIWLCSEKDQNF